MTIMPRIEANEQNQLAEMERKLDTMEKKLKRANRRFFSCFNCLVYFLILILAGIVWLAYAAALTGIVNVPYLSNKFFTKPAPSHIVAASTANDPQQALFDQLKLKTAEQFAQGKDVANVSISYSEGVLTKILQDYINKNGTDYEAAQFAVTDNGLELFLHKADSNIYITALIMPTVKDGKLALQLKNLHLGDFALPTSLGNLILKWFFAQPLNAMNALIKDFGSISGISFSAGGGSASGGQGQMIITFTVSKISKIF